MNNEIEGLQKELAKIKTHNQNSSIQMQAKVDALKIECVSLVHFVYEQPPYLTCQPYRQAETREKVRKLKEKTIAEIVTNVEEILKTKAYVSEQLEHLALMAKDDEARGLEEDPVAE